MRSQFNNNPVTREHVAAILEDFLEGRGSKWAWDDFISGMSFEDEYLETIRRRCDGLGQEFPPEKEGEYCNAKGRELIREYIRQLRGPGGELSTH